METKFKPIYNKENYFWLEEKELKDKQELSHLDDEYKDTKRKLLIRKIINRLVVFLVLILIIYWFFIRKSKKEVVEPEVIEQTPPVVQEEVPVVTQEETKKETKMSSLIPTVSPVNNTKPTSKPKLAISEFDGFVTMNGGEPIFNLCGGKEDLLIIKNSPLYNQFYNRYTSLAQGSYYARMYVVLKGHKVPVSYSGLGNSYTQGFYIEGINRMDFSGNCY